jgi:hypothetical protein
MKTSVWMLYWSRAGSREVASARAAAEDGRARRRAEETRRVAPLGRAAASTTRTARWLTQHVCSTVRKIVTFAAPGGRDAGANEFADRGSPRRPRAAMSGCRQGQLGGGSPLDGPAVLFRVRCRGGGRTRSACPSSRDHRGASSQWAASAGLCAGVPIRRQTGCVGHDDRVGWGGRAGRREVSARLAGRSVVPRTAGKDRPASRSATSSPDAHVSAGSRLRAGARPCFATNALDSP